MKKITALLFLSLYLFSVTGVKELFKINVLVQHFYETKKNDDTVTFSHFLIMHYITDDLNNKDNDRDEQLPFKSTKPFISNSNVFYIPNLRIQPLTAQYFTNKNAVKLIAKDLFIDTDFNSIIWRPPKYS